MIRKIVYAPRNRDNFYPERGIIMNCFIRNVGKWESLGGQISRFGCLAI